MRKGISFIMNVGDLMLPKRAVSLTRLKMPEQTREQLAELDANKRGWFAIHTPDKLKQDVTFLTYKSQKGFEDPKDVSGVEELVHAHYCPYQIGDWYVGDKATEKLNLGFVDVPWVPDAGDPNFIFTAAMTGCGFCVFRKDDHHFRIYHIQNLHQKGRTFDDCLDCIQKLSDLKEVSLIEAMLYDDYANNNAEKYQFSTTVFMHRIQPKVKEVKPFWGIFSQFCIMKNFEEFKKAGEDPSFVPRWTVDKLNCKYVHQNPPKIIQGRTMRYEKRTKEELEEAAEATKIMARAIEGDE